MSRVIDFPWAECYQKDEFPAQGWTTSYAALRRDRIPIYGLGWLISSEDIRPYLKPEGSWWSPSDLRGAAFIRGWEEHGFFGKLDLPRFSWLGNTDRDFCDPDTRYLIVYVVHNTPSYRKRYDNKTELNGMIEACLKIMDLPDEMKEPKWYPIMS